MQAFLQGAQASSGYLSDLMRRRQAQQQMEQQQEMLPLKKAYLQAQIAHQKAMADAAMRTPVTQMEQAQQFLKSLGAVDGLPGVPAQPADIPGAPSEPEAPEAEDMMPEKVAHPLLESPAFKGYELVSGGDPRFHRLDSLAASPYGSILSKAMGGKDISPKVSTKLNEKTGEQIREVYFPASNTVLRKVEQIGRSPEDVARATEMAKIDAKQLQDVNQALSSSEDVADVMHNIVDTINNYKSARGIIGPLNAPLTEFLSGDQEGQEVLGKLRSLEGNILMKMAPEFKGAFRKGEQKFIESIKFNTKDRFDVAKGKLKAQLIITEVARDRARKIADYMQGPEKLSYYQASRRAHDEVPFAPYKKRIESIFKEDRERQKLTRPSPILPSGGFDFSQFKSVGE